MGLGQKQIYEQEVYHARDVPELRGRGGVGCGKGKLVKMVMTKIIDYSGLLICFFLIF